MHFYSFSFGFLSSFCFLFVVVFCFVFFIFIDVLHSYMVIRGRAFPIQASSPAQSGGVVEALGGQGRK